MHSAGSMNPDTLDDERPISSISGRESRMMRIMTTRPTGSSQSILIDLGPEEEDQGKCWKRRTRLERLLSIAIIFSSAICITLLIAFVVSFITNTSPSICLSKACVHVAHDLSQFVDESVDPCEDIYNFACGTFLKSTTIPSDKSSVGAFQSVDDQMVERIRKLIEDESHEMNREEKSFSSIKTLYKSCMDMERREKLGIEPMMKLLAKFGGWPVLSRGNDGEDSWNEETFNWFDVVNQFEDLSIDYHLFDMKAHPDSLNASRYIIHISSPTFGKLRSFLLGPPDDPILRAYLDYQISIAMHLGAEDKNRVFIEMSDTLTFERDLASISKLRNYHGQVKEFHNPYKLGEIQLHHPFIPWLRLINDRLDPLHHLTKEDTINIINLNYVFDLRKLLDKTPKRTVANYLSWRLVKNYVHRLSKSSQNLSSKLRTLLKGTSEDEPRWQECIRTVIEKLPLAVSSLYIRHHFRKETHQVIQDIWNDIRTSFGATLQAANWLDEKTKGNAIEKLSAVKSRIGYPPELLDNGKMAGLFENLELSLDSFFENMINISIFQSKIHFAALWRPKNESDWIRNGNVARVNAYYDSGGNSMNILAGILEAPFFAEGRPAYTNYGGIGWVIGHELGHGYDEEGIQFGGNGILDEWWSKESREEFYNRTECIIRQYDEYYVEDIEERLSGLGTLNENLADNSGIREAYRAYKDWVGRNGGEGTLPGFDYNPLQLFWISGARNWCEKSRVEEQRVQVNYDVHAPGRQRVVGTFSNMQEFARDFGCRVGSKMNPEKKCRVW